MLTSHELIGFMSPALATDILNFAHQSDKELYRATLTAVANTRKLRPVFLERQPRTQRHETMISTLARPGLELAASTLIRGWLMKKYQAMLVDFLNGLGIQHKEGVVEELPETIDDAKLKPAIDELLAKYPPEVVSVYMNAFNSMNETRWNNLDALLKEDSRLQLGG